MFAHHLDLCYPPLFPRRRCPNRSQKTADVPTLASEDRQYDIKYFSRNTRREGHIGIDGKSTRYEDEWATAEASAAALALVDPEAPLGSPGNHYTASTVKLYDPTGLRSAMTATHAEMYKSIAVRVPTAAPRGRRGASFC